MEEQTSVYPHEVNFLQCNGMVDLIDLVSHNWLPGKYTLRNKLLKNTIVMVDLIDPVVIGLPRGRSRPV